MSSKTIIYIDMDNTLCDFTSAFLATKRDFPEIEYPQSKPGFFKQLEPLPNAIETYRWLHQQESFDVYVLSAPSVWNPLSYTEKRQWIGDYFDIEIAHKLILCPNKALCKGHYLIDDIVAGKGQEGFEGELIQFGSKDYPDWSSVKAKFESIA